MIDRTAEQGSSRGRLIRLRSFIPDNLPDATREDSGKILQFRRRNTLPQQSPEEDPSPFNIPAIPGFRMPTWHGHTTFTPGQVGAYERAKLLSGNSDFIG
jgi:hypothetical protein